MIKKNYKPKCLPAITKNLNCHILTKNLVTFKIENGVKNEKYYYGVSPIFRGGESEKNNIYGELPKKGAWTICRGLGKK